jgi:hypothetical protein
MSARELAMTYAHECAFPAGEIDVVIFETVLACALRRRTG